jgi:Holliday junction resolvase RusA-like endonuclease
VTAITFFVPGVPVAQPRQRHRVVVGRGGKAYATNYTPKDAPVNDYKEAARIAAWRAMGRNAPLNVPVGVSVEFVFPRPKSLTRKRGNPRSWKGNGEDVDNLSKSLFDALSGVVFDDDCRVAMAWVIKCVAGDGDRVGTRVKVRALDPAEVDLFTEGTEGETS